MEARAKRVYSARINPQGVFELIHRENGRLGFFMDCCIKDVIRDAFGFLNSNALVGAIGSIQLVRGKTMKGLDKCEFSYLEPAYDVKMYKKSNGFATVVILEPLIYLDGMAGMDDFDTDFDEEEEY